MSDDVIKFVSKGWGWEKIIANSELYCGKLLYVVKGKQCSAHYHEKKEETFFAQSGVLDVWYVRPKSWEKVYDPDKEASDYAKWWNSERLKAMPWTTTKVDAVVLFRRLLPGDKFHLPVRTIHQFKAVQDTELFEFSTQHFDEDSFRIVKGD